MNAKLKVFQSTNPEDLEKQVSSFLKREVASIIKIHFIPIKVSKVVEPFEVEVDAYDCFLLYVPLLEK